MRSMYELIKLSLRNLRRRKLRSAAAVLAVMIAVALYVSLNLMSYSVMISSLSAFTEHVGDFDVVIRKTKGSPFFNVTNVTRALRQIPGVAVIGPRLIFGGVLEDGGTRVRVVVIGLNMTEEHGIGSIIVVNGSLRLGGNACLVLEGVAGGAIRPGDVVRLWYLNLTGSVKCVNLTVSAVVEQRGKLPSDIKNVVFIDLADAQRMLGAEDLANLVLVKLEPSLIDPFDVERSIDRIVHVCEEIQKTLGFEFSVDPVKATVLERVSEGIEAMKTLLSAFVSVTLTVAVLLIVLTMTMNVNERIREIGILRSLGMSRAEILAMFLLEAVVIGLLGGLIGATLSVIIAPQILRAMLPPDSRFTTYEILVAPRLQDVIMAVMLGILTSLLGGLYPAVRASRVSPVEALQPTARRVKYLEEIEKRISPESVNRNLVFLGVGVTFYATLSFVVIPLVSVYGDMRTSFLIFLASVLMILVSVLLVFSGVFPKLAKALGRMLSVFSRVWGSISSGNILRYRQRAMLIFFMLAFALSSLLLVSILIRTELRLVELSIKAQAGADIIVYAREPLPENVTSMLKHVEGVLAVCPVTQPLTCDVGDVIMWRRAVVRVYGIDPESYSMVSYLSEFGIDPSVFAHLSSQGTVIISEGLAALLEISVGDVIRVNLRNRVILLKVVAVLPLAPGFTFTKFKSKASTTTDILVSLETFKNITGELTLSRIMVKVSSNFSPESVAKDIQQVLGDEYDVQTISISDYIERARESMLRLERVLELLLSFSIAVALAGEFIAMATVIRERLWEIGVLRSMGASRLDIALMFALEILIVAILAAMCGTAGTILVSYELIYAMNVTSEIPIGIVVPLETLLGVLAAVIVPSTLLAVALGYKYSGRNIAEILSKAERV